MKKKVFFFKKYYLGDISVLLQCRPSLNCRSYFVHNENLSWEGSRHHLRNFFVPGCRELKKKPYEKILRTIEMGLPVVAVVDSN